ncbi:DNA polymerase III subunit delta' C-terminal domain-containing protein [Acinetobacter stercoris]|uniref:DNA-directed DNA polymerase n=1 Tax=Acinetobacter stercoris TaxID=2126983 RepID=A0A2U3MWM9_9GAMM|nr:DNA polymerase III subunit delta' C-terminal domain-containing protein [Acinetobacter stercoris]SPL69840.1 DNA polymerase III subunit tau [Acinetobacter stercoris]
MNMQTTPQVYPWQQQVWETLTGRFPNIGHGLLFYGRKGCGKKDFAQHFLSWVLCLNKQPNGACGVCSSCQWIKSDTHPNYVYITTDEDNKMQNAKIKIEKIRDLLPFVQQTVDGWRVIVIEPAEALNIASSNALLKTLEEPGERVILILIADHYLKLPATIRSRLQHFALDRVTASQGEAYLNEYLADSKQQIPLLMNLANQMPLQALALSNSEWIRRRQDFVNDWQRLVIQKSMPIQLATKWNKELNFTDFIQMFEYLLADVICVKLEQTVKNKDIDFEVLADQYTLEVLFNIYNLLQQSKMQVEQNVQSNLVMDQLFIDIMSC